VLEGATADAYETIITATDATADRTITLPDATGTVVVKDSSDVVTITSTADNGPTLDLKSDDHSDASDFATEGKIRFYADNDANEQVVYNQITSVTADVTDGTEDGWLYLGNMVNGTLTNAFAAANKSLYFLQDDSTIQFRAWGGTAYHVTVTPSTPTANRTITLPDATGTAALTNGNAVLLNTTTVSSGVSSVDFGSSLITDTYNDYLLVVSGATVSASTRNKQRSRHKRYLCKSCDIKWPCFR